MPERGVRAVLERDGRFLLAQHNHLRPENKGHWGFLGGFVDAEDASTADALRRELPEELGVEVEVGRALGTVERRGREVEIRVAHVVGDPSPRTGEILKLGWFDPKGVQDLARRGLLVLGCEAEFVQRYLKHRSSADTEDHFRL